MKTITLLAALLVSQACLAGGTQTNPITLLLADGYIQARAVPQDIDSEFDPVFASASTPDVLADYSVHKTANEMIVTQASVVAASQDSTIIKISVSGTDTLVEVENSELVKSDELLRKLQSIYY